MILTKKTKIIALTISIFLVAAVIGFSIGTDTGLNKFLKGEWWECSCGGTCSRDTCGARSWCRLNIDPTIGFYCTPQCDGCDGWCNESGGCDDGEKCLGGDRGTTPEHWCAPDPDLEPPPCVLCGADCDVDSACPSNECVRSGPNSDGPYYCTPPDLPEIEIIPPDTANNVLIPHNPPITIVKPGERTLLADFEFSLEGSEKQVVSHQAPVGDSDRDPNILDLIFAPPGPEDVPWESCIDSDKTFCNITKINFNIDLDVTNPLDKKYIKSLRLYELVPDTPIPELDTLSAAEISYTNQFNKVPGTIKRDCKGAQIQISNDVDTFNEQNSVDFDVSITETMSNDYCVEENDMYETHVKEQKNKSRDSARIGLFATIANDSPVTKLIKISTYESSFTYNDDTPVPIRVEGEANLSWGPFEIDGGKVQIINNTNLQPTQIMQENKPPPAKLLDLNIKTTEGSVNVYSINAHFEKKNGEPFSPKFAEDSIKVYTQKIVRSYEQFQSPVPIGWAEIVQKDNKLIIDFNSERPIEFTRDTTTRLFIEAEALDVNAPTDEFRLVINAINNSDYPPPGHGLDIKGDFLKTIKRQDCNYDQYPGVGDFNNTEHPCITVSTRENDGLSSQIPKKGPDIKIIPTKKLKIESKQWPNSPQIIRQNRTNLNIGEIIATSSWGVSEIMGFDIALEPGQSMSSLQDALENLKIKTIKTIRKTVVGSTPSQPIYRDCVFDPESAKRDCGISIVSNIDENELIELKATIKQEQDNNIISVRLNPPLTINDGFIDTLKLVADIKASVQAIEFTPQIVYEESILQVENDEAKIISVLPLKIGPTTKIPVDLAIDSIKSSDSLPYYSESDAPFEIAKFRLNSTKQLEIKKFILTLKDDAPSNRIIFPLNNDGMILGHLDFGEDNKMPFSKIRELKIYDENSPDEELCNVTINAETKIALAECSSLQLNEELSRTIVVMAKLNYGVVNGQKFALGIAKEADIVTDYPIITTGIPAYGPEFTSSGNSGIEIKAIGENTTVTPTGNAQLATLITIHFKTMGGDASVIKKLKKIVLNKTTASDFDSSKIGELHLFKTDRSEYASGGFGGDLVGLTKTNSTGQITIEFPTEEGAGITQLNTDQEITLSAKINPSGADKDKVLQYSITSVDIEPSSVNKIIVQADGPKMTFGGRVCQNGKVEKSNGTCACPDRTNEYIDQPTKYSIANGNVCIPCFEEDLVTVDGVLMCPQDKPVKSGSLLITARLPDGQNTSLAQGEDMVVKAIEIDMGKTGGDLLGDQLKRFTLEYEGDFDKSKLVEPELWRTGDANVRLTDEQITITPSSTTGLYTFNFKTPLVIGNMKKLIFYVRTSITDGDSGKKFRYKVTNVETEPSEAISKVYMSGDASPGPQFVVANKPTLTVINNIINDNNGTGTPADFPLLINNEEADYGANVLGAGTFTLKQTPNPSYKSSTWGGACSADGRVTLAAGEQKTCTITNDDVALAYCESKGKFTYTGRDIPGLLYGSCIECPNEQFNSDSGKCEETLVVVEPGGGDNGFSPPPDNIKQTPVPDEINPEDSTPDSVPDNTDSTPDLRGSARLVSVPDRGNTGPEVIIYFGAIISTYAIMNLCKKRK